MMVADRLREQTICIRYQQSQFQRPPPASIRITACTAYMAFTVHLSGILETMKWWLLYLHLGQLKLSHRRTRTMECTVSMAFMAMQGCMSQLARTLCMPSMGMLRWFSQLTPSLTHTHTMVCMVSATSMDFMGL